MLGEFRQVRESPAGEHYCLTVGGPGGWHHFHPFDETLFSTTQLLCLSTGEIKLFVLEPTHNKRRGLRGKLAFRKEPLSA